MKPTLEQIKIYANLWPEGASHFIESAFVKWVDGVEFNWGKIHPEWLEVEICWSQEQYAEQGYRIIPRPIKTERELFSEAVDSLIKPHHWTAIEVGGALYDSGKFKLAEPTK